MRKTHKELKSNSEECASIRVQNLINERLIPGPEMPVANLEILFNVSLFEQRTFGPALTTQHPVAIPTVPVLRIPKILQSPLQIHFARVLCCQVHPSLQQTHLTTPPRMRNQKMPD